MPDEHPSSGGRREPAPRRTYTFAAAGVLFCLAAGLVSWAGTTLTRAEPAPAAVVVPAAPSGRPAASTRSRAEVTAAELRRAKALNQKRSAADANRPDGGPDASRGPRRPPAAPLIKAPVPVVSTPDPEQITIPSLGIEQGIVELAVNADTLQVPQDFWDVGWWSGGTAPGDRGAAVMVGHVDSFDGPAVFYGLSSMRRGDKIFVHRDRGPRLTFAVRKKVLYDRDRFPSDKVYRAGGRPSLHLLTCGGSFDAEAGLYSGNVVVYAELVPPAKKPAAKKPDAKKQAAKKPAAKKPAERGRGR